MLRENYINIESKIRSSQFSYTDFINNMKLLVVVIPPSIYYDCFTLKTFREEKFTQVNMKIVVVGILGNTGR